jgi:hypothetical protein
MKKYISCAVHECRKSYVAYISVICIPHISGLYILAVWVYWCVWYIGTVTVCRHITSRHSTHTLSFISDSTVPSRLWVWPTAVLNTPICWIAVIMLLVTPAVILVSRTLTELFILPISQSLAHFDSSYPISESWTWPHLTSKLTCCHLAPGSDLFPALSYRAISSSKKCAHSYLLLIPSLEHSVHSVKLSIPCSVSVFSMSTLSEKP